MKDYVIDVLMNIGVPAGIKGFTYICDAIELFNTDPYYPDGKISALYIDIAKKYHTTPSSRAFHTTRFRYCTYKR